MKIKNLLIACLTLLVISACVRMQTVQLDIMPEWSLGHVKSVLRATEGTRMFPMAEDREAWARYKNNQSEEWLAGLFKTADHYLDAPLPELPATLFLEFHRTGNRTHYEGAYGQLSAGLGPLTIAECIQHEGRYLDVIMNRSWRLCELSTWELPAHTKDLPYLGKTHIDLRVAEIAQQLAMIVYVLGDDLHPALVDRIYREINIRAFEPYFDKERKHGWMQRTNNWNAVCNGGVLGAALGLEPLMHERGDSELFYKVIHSTQNSIRASMRGFGIDGGTSEGISYWGYGFGHYVDASALLSLRTGGKLDFLQGEHVKRVASFPINIRLAPGLYPSFSDSRYDYRLPYWLSVYLSQKLAIPELAQAAIEENSSKAPRYSSPLLGLLEVTDTLEPLSNLETIKQPASTYLRGVQWFIARCDPSKTDGLILVAKAGNNNEPHNHNDVGSFIVLWKGEPLLVDPGAPVYSRDFFSPRRYEFFAASSRGHSVPVVANQYQANGEMYTGKVLEYVSTNAKEQFVVELKGAYPKEAGIESLRRDFTLERSGTGKICIEDEAQFQNSQTYEEVLITFDEVETPKPGLLRIHGSKGSLEIGYEPQNADVHVESYESKEFQLRVSDPMVRRIVLKTTEKAPKFRFDIRPLE